MTMTVFTWMVASLLGSALVRAESPTRRPFQLSRWQAGPVEWGESGFARYWGDVPKLSALSEVDAVLVSHRHAVFKHLITCDATGGEPLFGRDAQYHWLWAYSAQLDWQDRSGRLNPDAAAAPAADSAAAPSSDGTIQLDSWWSLMNIVFSLCVLVGAADAGLVARPAFTQETDECLRTPSFQACTAGWEAFWRQDHAAFVAAAREAKSELELEMLREELQRKVWLIHQRAMDLGLQASARELAALPPDEASFGRGWCKMVELLASVVWKTDLATLLRDGVGCLPSMRLVPGALQLLEVEAPKEHAAVCAAMQLSAMPDAGLGLASGFWRRVAHWRHARRRMAATLKNITYERHFLPLALARLAGLAAAPRRAGEVVGWLVIAMAARRFCLTSN